MAIKTLVLNLVISGIPSIHSDYWVCLKLIELGFKPCYKWNTFNTLVEEFNSLEEFGSFKPCYKWNTFNTAGIVKYLPVNPTVVLNLVISGIPSIL